MKEFIKFALKAGAALFIIGVGTKLGKDGISNLQQFKNNRKQLSNGEFK